MPVRSATATQISGTSTPSRSRVTIVWHSWSVTSPLSPDVAADPKTVGSTPEGPGPSRCRGDEPSARHVGDRQRGALGCGTLLGRPSEIDDPHDPVVAL